MKHKPLKLVLLSLATVAPCSGVSASNLGGDGGSLRPLPGQASPLRLERESVVIRCGGTYAVRTDYVFRNGGMRGVYALAVPEQDQALLDRGEPLGTGLGGLAVYVDGRRVQVRQKLMSRTSQTPKPNVLWVAHVPFRRGETRCLRVEYHSCVWGSCAAGMYYHFGEQVWRSDVPRTTLTIIDPDYDPDIGPSVSLEGQAVPLRHRGNHLYAQWNHNRPLGSLEVM